MNSSVAVAIMVLALAGVSEPVVAPSPTGMWKWTIADNGRPREANVKLRFDSEGPTLTGIYSDGPGTRLIPLAEASYSDNEGLVSFIASRENNGRKLTIRYSGMLKGDTITGKRCLEYNGQLVSTDWIAKRQR